jgi:hypothetical protein
VGAENANPLNELQDLGRQIDQAEDLDVLKPIFARVDQLAKLHSGDLDVQLSTEELKQRIVERGKTLRAASSDRMRGVNPPSAAPVAVAPPPASPQALEPQYAPQENGSPSVAAPPPPARPAVQQAATARTSSPAVGERKKAQTTPPSAKKPGGWKRPLILGIIAGSIISILLVAFLVNRSRRGLFSGAEVQVQVTTVPPGASIRVNGETKCQSNCSVPLTAPGSYQFTAFLDGYEPAAATVDVERGRPRMLSMALEPARQSLRILTDLPQGSVSIDDQTPLDLQDGQFAMDNVQPGTHTIKVSSRTGEASFTIAVEPAKLPAVQGPIAVKNLAAVAAATMGNTGRVYASSGPQKLTLNGTPQGDVGPSGVDLTNYQAGTAELAVGEGKDQKLVSDTFSPSPALTLFLKSDLNIGTLVVSAGEDDVRVFVNDKEYPRRTKRGQLRIPTIGNVAVRVAKEGFEPVQPQSAEVKKGAEARLEFKLQASPKFAALLIRGATPGAEVLVDQKSVGTVGDDGSFANNAVAPGDHTVELRRDQYLPKRLQRSFRAGQSITLAGADAVLTSALGTVRVARTPADAAVTYRRADEAQGQGRELRGGQVELQPGAYVFTARAPGFTDKSERVQVTPGEGQSVELTLARVVVAAAPPPPKANGMAEFENPSAWSQQGDVWVHRGGGVVPYKAIPNGVFTFTVELLKGGNLFRGGKIRWVAQYIDAKNYNLFELDRKSLSSKVISNGKTFDRGKFDHNLSEKDKSYTIQIDSRREHLVTKFMVNGEWKTIDSWDEADRDFTAGKFGFLIQGSDEIGLTDFKFVPR